MNFLPQNTLQILVQGVVIFVLRSIGVIRKFDDVWTNKNSLNHFFQ